MAYIDNTQTKREIDDAIRGNSVTNLAPTKVSDNVQLVLNVNPKDYKNSEIVLSNTCVNSTSSTIYTTPTDRDFYLTSAQLSMIKDAGALSTYSAINCTINGDANVRLIRVIGLATTAQTESLSISFPAPVKVDRGTAITVINSNAGANVSASGLIAGYLI